MFTLILGPMKSGKSLELISRTSPHNFTDSKVVFVQPQAHVRDTGIHSRAGNTIDAMSVDSLKQIKEPFDVLAIDEVHMFAPADTKLIEKWLKEGKSFVISGLDLDYRGKMPPIIKNLLELKPDEVVFKIAVCDVCKKYNAPFSQILSDGEPVLSGLPVVIPEDGTYTYEARCRDHFIKE